MYQLFDLFMNDAGFFIVTVAMLALICIIIISLYGILKA